MLTVLEEPDEQAHPENVTRIEIAGKNFYLHGTELLLTDYLTSWTQELYEQRLLWFWTAHLPEGIHPQVT